MAEKFVYMDNNATTPVHPKVKETMREYIDIYGNASSFHSFGRKARKKIEEARENTASFISSFGTGIISFSLPSAALWSGRLWWSKG